MSLLNGTKQGALRIAAKGPPCFVIQANIIQPVAAAQSGLDKALYKAEASSLGA